MVGSVGSFVSICKNTPFRPARDHFCSTGTHSKSCKITYFRFSTSWRFSYEYIMYSFEKRVYSARPNVFFFAYFKNGCPGLTSFSTDESRAANSYKILTKVPTKLFFQRSVAERVHLSLLLKKYHGGTAEVSCQCVKTLPFVLRGTTFALSKIKHPLLICRHIYVLNG